MEEGMEQNHIQKQRAVHCLMQKQHNIVGSQDYDCSTYSVTTFQLIDETSTSAGVDHDATFTTKRFRGCKPFTQVNLNEHERHVYKTVSGNASIAGIKHRVYLRTSQGYLGPQDLRSQSGELAPAAQNGMISTDRTKHNNNTRAT